MLYSLAFPNTKFYVCPVICMGITKDNWHKAEQGIDRVFGELARKEVDIRSVWRYRNIYPIAIEAVRTGKIDLKHIEPAMFPFEKSQEAFEYAFEHRSELYALLSSLSGIPINQSLAVTGSVNQKGQIQPIGGVNEKIEMAGNPKM